ncbi:hypothetical protein ABFA07_022972 [Porites harrisoni]
MALQSFLLSLLVLNMCWRSESACRMADWWAAFDRKGWANCDSSTQYIKGLWRNHNGGPKEKIYLLEQAKCCSAPTPYANVPSTCKIANWWSVLDGKNVWAVCPTGYFLQGLCRNDGVAGFTKLNRPSAVNRTHCLTSMDTATTRISGGHLITMDSVSVREPATMRLDSTSQTATHWVVLRC